jgi:hypothetical protein
MGDSGVGAVEKGRKGQVRAGQCLPAPGPPPTGLAAGGRSKSSRKEKGGHLADRARLQPLRARDVWSEWVVGKREQVGADG